MVYPNASGAVSSTRKGLCHTMPFVVCPVMCYPKPVESPGDGLAGRPEGMAYEGRRRSEDHGLR